MKIEVQFRLEWLENRAYGKGEIKDKICIHIALYILTDSI